MSGNDWAVWSGAIVASLLLHGLLFFNTGSLAGNNERVEPKRSTTRVSFRSVTAPQAVPQPQPPMPEKPPEPEVTEAPEPPPEPEPPQPEKRTQKARQPQKQPQPPQQRETPPVPTTEVAEKQPAAAEAVKGTVNDPAVIEQARQEYLRRLMAHIEAHKHYPRAARRRGIEGEVAVSFTLLAGGRVTALSVDGSQRVLTGAARDAVETAEPMPAPPQTLPLPWEVSFTMRFTLR